MGAPESPGLPLEVHSQICGFTTQTDSSTRCPSTGLVWGILPVSQSTGPRATRLFLWCLKPPLLSGMGCIPFTSVFPPHLKACFY